jgi:hypothetical protein
MDEASQALAESLADGIPDILTARACEQAQLVVIVLEWREDWMGSGSKLQTPTGVIPALAGWKRKASN